MIERLPRPAILVHGEGAVSFANSRAQDVVRAGRHFVMASGRLRFLDRRFDQDVRNELARLVEETSGSKTPLRSVLRFPRSGDTMQGAISLTPFAPDSSLHVFGNLTQVLVCLHELSCHAEPDLALWQAALDLTPAQARVAAEIYRGGTLKEAARALGISESTVKTHLDAVFAKTGTDRQAAAVRVLAELAG